ncbi:GLUG motif-containing protein [Natranaeroarchaeum aerophilus]|uniref:Uncharacterized protein n=1 Tax=Natranaeroarchaeum aerophilus TaxID=2917711 RepID=A0AAE3FPR3_9EURY|nr:GLUG motif-containing protein [Natranaeroarchaeum aerophilus]MCL9812896.1 hypothetical protein [Natranaeroarchaeum aerophilus]
MTVLAVSGLAIGPAAADEAADLDELAGEGTEANPYVITTVEELQAMNQDLEAHYVLGNDIDASETDAWDAGQGFVPIGDRVSGDRSTTLFSGSFDGQGHTVTGLTIERPGSDYVGPFGGSSGTIENVTFEDVDMQGNTNVGGVVGYTTGEVRYVTVTGTVESKEGDIGGIAGRVSEGTVERASVDATVRSGESHAGGVIGTTFSEITEVSSAGTVHSEDAVAGGVVGHHASDAVVTQAYSSADVSAPIGVGGAFGSHDEPSIGVYSTGAVDASEEDPYGFAGFIPNNGAAPSTAYWDVDSSETDVGIGNDDEHATGLRTSEMTGAAAEENMDLDFGEYWTTTDEYPILQWQVEEVDLSVTQSTIGEGESTSATVELTLHDGSTVTASEVADYDTEEAIASVEDGSVEANSIGQTDITATVAGQSDTVSVEVLEPPSIEFVDAELDTETVVEGTTAKVSATYENTGGPGSETVSVAVGDEQASITTFQLDADEETTETITWSADRSGTVSLGDDEELGELQVVEPANVSLQSVELPEEATQDREYEIEPVFETDLDTSVWTTLELRVDGDRVLEDEFEVREDGTVEPIEYVHDEDGTTTHVVEHYDQTETGTVEVLPPADFELEDLEVPETVEQGDTETVGVTVRNVGGGIDDAEIALALDGEEVDTQAVTLDRNEDTTVEFDATFDDAGDVELVVSSPDDEIAQSMTVDGGDEGESTDESDDDDGLPGFTVVAGLVAVLVTLGAVARRE